MMEFGISFFPNVGPEEKSGQDYWGEALSLVDLCDPLGYTHVRTVEHYFHPYGGYSPNPIVFLTAASQRTKNARLVTGAVLPAFNNPLKLAGEIAMLDAISGGRLDVGMARAFWHESISASIWTKAVDATMGSAVPFCRKKMSLWRAISTPSTTSRCRARRSIASDWVAALQSEESFTFAGRNGFNCMANPIGGAKMRDLLGLYHDAWKCAGHPGRGKVALAFMMYCAPTTEQAIEEAGPDVRAYFQTLADAASDWSSGSSSKDYPGYEKMVEILSKEDVHTQREKSAAFVGSPEECRDSRRRSRILIHRLAGSISRRCRSTPR